MHFELFLRFNAWLLCTHFSTLGLHLEPKNYVSNRKLSRGAAGLRFWCRACGDEIAASVAGTRLMESTRGTSESGEKLDGEQCSTCLLDVQHHVKVCRWTACGVVDFTGIICTKTKSQLLLNSQIMKKTSGGGGPGGLRPSCQTLIFPQLSLQDVVLWIFCGCLRRSGCFRCICRSVHQTACRGS